MSAIGRFCCKRQLKPFRVSDSVPLMRFATGAEVPKQNSSGGKAARAQPAKQPVVGVLGSASPAAYTERLTAIRQGLAETGWCG
jgi:hypothetical protein